MSQENVEIVRRLIEACNRRDWDAMLETGDSEIQIVTLMSGTHRGHAGWRRVVEQMAEEVSGFSSSRRISYCSSPTDLRASVRDA